MKRRDPSPGSPLPYAGQELDRRANLGRPFVKHGHGSDQASGREYRFNSLGFRGPEFDPRASRRIYAFGESHAFGYFVAGEECWPARFAELWGRARGLAPGELCFQNFADVGSSNAGIARSVVTQCTAAPPDLVLIHFGEHRRSEVYLDGRPHRVGAWLLDEATARAAPPDGPLRSGYLEQIERARAFYRHALGDLEVEETTFSIERDATCVENALRDILLVQYFCRAKGIAAIATCDLVDYLFNETTWSNESLGPLLMQVDRDFLVEERIWSVEGDRADDGQHAGALRHERFARLMLRHHLERPFPAHRQTVAEPPTLVRERRPTSEMDDTVRAFYDAQPFNHWSSVARAAASIRDSRALASYPDLQRLLATGEIHTALDAGCGGGWLSNALAFHHGLVVTGVDFSARSLERAHRVAEAVAVDSRLRFLEGDLLALELDQRFDLVISLGVLHHLADPKEGCRRVAGLAAPGGALYLGLYHAPGRRPFLDHFERLLGNGGGGDARERAFEAFRRLADDGRSDEEHLRSWFRDQVLHPRESQHTLRELDGWLGELGWEIVSTSINHFEPFERVDALFTLEADYEERSRRALAEGRFFPGFFTVLARRVGDIC